MFQSGCELRHSNVMAQHSNNRSSFVVRNVIENCTGLSFCVHCGVGHRMCAVGGIELHRLLKILNHKLRLQIPIFFDHCSSEELEISGEAFVEPKDKFDLKELNKILIKKFFTKFPTTTCMSKDLRTTCALAHER